jgi:HPt (histidine-containing phosphotransfer) domain-containing protein
LKSAASIATAPEMPNMDPLRANAHSDIIDRAWSLKQIGGDEELFGDIARVFLIDSPNLRQQLEADMAAGNAEAVRHTAHSIRSAVGNFGAKQAMTAAQALEIAAKTGEQARLPKLAEALQQELLAVEHALRPFAS